MESKYTVQLAVFEGPLDLLLQLIEREELDITTVALVQVADQYLEHLQRLPEREIDDLAEFLVVAAKLLQIKSEALLPRLPERQPEEEDPAESLARQLILYRQFKRAASGLGKREREGLQSYLRMADVPTLPTELDLEGIGLEALQAAMLEALSGFPELEEAVEPPRILIRDKIDAIIASLARSESMSFLNMLAQADTRLDVVVAFLAVLDLIKSREIRAVQERPFAEILLSRGPSWGNAQDRDRSLDGDE
jgi:segregation and condensation protein A